MIEPAASAEQDRWSGSITVAEWEQVNRDAEMFGEAFLRVDQHGLLHRLPPAAPDGDRLDRVALALLPGLPDDPDDPMVSVVWAYELAQAAIDAIGETR